MSERYTVVRVEVAPHRTSSQHVRATICGGGNPNPVTIHEGALLPDLNAAAAALARVEALAEALDAEADACDELISGAALNLAGVLDARSRAKRDAAARIRAALTGKE